VPRRKRMKLQDYKCQTVQKRLTLFPLFAMQLPQFTVRVFPMASDWPYFINNALFWYFQHHKARKLLSTFVLIRYARISREKDIVTVFFNELESRSMKIWQTLFNRVNKNTASPLPGNQVLYTQCWQTAVTRFLLLRISVIHLGNTL